MWCLYCVACEGIQDRLLGGAFLSEVLMLFVDLWEVVWLLFGFDVGCIDYRFLWFWLCMLIF